MVVQHEPQRLVDLARTVEAPTSSTHLLLRELVKTGFVRVTQDRRYAPGPGLVSLSLRLVDGMHIIDVARPVMRQLLNRVDEDVYIALPQDRSIVYAYRMMASHSLRLEIGLGVPRALHATAVGQLFLATLAEQECAELLETLDLTPRTPYTLTDRATLESRLANIRERGWSRTDQENYENVVAYAVPVYGPDGRMVLALSLSVVRSRSLGRDDELSRELRTAAEDLTSILCGDTPRPGAGA
jgi:DNA-binding IclR family transcriptional regulator